MDMNGQKNEEHEAPRKTVELTKFSMTEFVQQMSAYQNRPLKKTQLHFVFSPHFTAYKMITFDVFIYVTHFSSLQIQCQNKQKPKGCAAAAADLFMPLLPHMYHLGEHHTTVVFIQEQTRKGNC